MNHSSLFPEGFLLYAHKLQLLLLNVLQYLANLRLLRFDNQRNTSYQKRWVTSTARRWKVHAFFVKFRISNERFSKVIIQVDYTSCFQHPLLSLEGLFKHGVKSYFFFLFSVPQPIILFPLNAEYRTRDIKDRTAPGIPSGVSLAPGPYGEEDGSYEFFGNASSFIEFPNSPGGALDVRYSMTILCWVYYDEKGGPDGPIFNYYTGDSYGVHIWVLNGLFYACFNDRTFSYPLKAFFHTSLAGGWKFVGASYDNETGEIKLWADGALKQTRNTTAGMELGTQGSVRMGVSENGRSYFKGKISYKGSTGCPKVVSFAIPVWD